MEYAVCFIMSISLTVCLYISLRYLQLRYNCVLLNPVLLSIAILIVLITSGLMTYDYYHEGSKWLEILFKPAVVALGIPLYQQIRAIRRNFIPILISQIAASIGGILSVIFIAKCLGADKSIIISLAPKSVTTPIAMNISEICGGVPSLTAAVVVCVGILGAMIGKTVMRLGRISHWMAMGIAMGTASHAVGTSEAMKWGERYGAFSSVGLILNGILTAIFTPWLL